MPLWHARPTVSAPWKKSVSPPFTRLASTRVSLTPAPGAATRSSFMPRPDRACSVSARARASFLWSYKLRKASRPMSPRRAAPRPHAPRLRASRPDRRVLGEPEDAHLRRAVDRLRGGSRAAGGAGGDAARGRALTGRAATRIIDPCAGRRPVATRLGAPSPGLRLSARSALDASPRSLARSTRGASASGSSSRSATARTGARHSSRSGSHAPC